MMVFVWVVFYSVVQNPAFDLLVFPVWSMFSRLGTLVVPFCPFLGRVPILKQATEESWCFYSNLSGGPIVEVQKD